MEKTREQWLNEMVLFYAPEFSRLSYSLADKKIRVSVGFPSSRAKTHSHRSIGEVWSNTCSHDNSFEIFVSPVIKDSLEAAATLLHELVHVAVGLDKGHRSAFRRCALAVGLAGQMRATVAGEKLKETLQTIIAVLGEIPHAELSVSGRKKQSTRMIKCVCSVCGYTVRISRWWLQKAVPECPVCMVKMNEGVYTNSMPWGELV